MSQKLSRNAQASLNNGKSITCKRELYVASRRERQRVGEQSSGIIRLHSVKTKDFLLISLI